MTSRLDAIVHLPQAPITEAVLDVRVRARSDITSADLRSVHKTIASEYPKLEERRQLTTQFNVADVAKGKPVKATARVDGYFFRSADGLDIVQFRVDGFSVNRLRPYTRWEAWFPRFERLWALYLDIAKPLAATRAAARCINHISARPEGLLGDIFSAPLEVPDGVPENVKAFRTSVTVSNDGDPPQLLNLAQALELGPDGRSLQFLLDIDAFTVGEFATSQVVDLFGPLHELRNRAFFQSLTPQTIERFR